MVKVRSVEEINKELEKKEEIKPVAGIYTELPKKKKPKKPRTPAYKKEIDLLKKEIENIKNQLVQEKNFLNDLDIKTCWESLQRSIRQLSGKNRSPDWKRGAIPVKDKLEKYLKEMNIINEN